MAKKKDNSVFYVPAIDIKDVPLTETINTQEVQNYQDPGVSFNGYSKTKVGNNQYKLFRQTFSNSNPAFAWTASNAELTLQINPDYQTKIFYITDIIVSSQSNTLCSFKLYDNSGKLLYRHYNLDATSAPSTIHIKLNVPYPFDKETLYIRPNNFSEVPVAITGRIGINLFGYVEDKA